MQKDSLTNFPERIKLPLKPRNILNEILSTLIYIV